MCVCVCVCVCVCAAIVERPRAETAAVIERAHIHISGHLAETVIQRNKPRFQTHLKATSRRLSHIGPLRNSDHVRQKWNTPRDGGLHPSFCLPPPRAFNFLSWAPAARLVPGCLGLICYDSNFKCLLGLKARQQIRRIIKVNGAFYSWGLWNWSYRLQEEMKHVMASVREKHRGCFVWTAVHLEPLWNRTFIMFLMVTCVSECSAGICRRSEAAVEVHHSGFTHQWSDRCDRWKVNTSIHIIVFKLRLYFEILQRVCVIRKPWWAKRGRVFFFSCFKKNKYFFSKYTGEEPDLENDAQKTQSVFCFLCLFFWPSSDSSSCSFYCFHKWNRDTHGRTDENKKQMFFKFQACVKMRKPTFCKKWTLEYFTPWYQHRPKKLHIGGALLQRSCRCCSNKPSVLTLKMVQDQPHAPVTLHQSDTAGKNTAGVHSESLQKKQQQISDLQLVLQAVVKWDSEAGPVWASCRCHLFSVAQSFISFNQRRQIELRGPAESQIDHVSSRKSAASFKGHESWEGGPPPSSLLLFLSYREVVVMEQQIDASRGQNHRTGLN